MTLNNQNLEFQNQLINIRRQKIESYLLKCGSMSKLSIKCSFGQLIFCQLSLLFILFLLLFMSPTTFFDTIQESYCTILANFHIYLQHFQQKIFSFSKISGFQTNPKCENYLLKCESLSKLSIVNISLKEFGGGLSMHKVQWSFIFNILFELSSYSIV